MQLIYRKIHAIVRPDCKTVGPADGFILIQGFVFAVRTGDTNAVYTQSSVLFYVLSARYSKREQLELGMKIEWNVELINHQK